MSWSDYSTVLLGQERSPQSPGKKHYSGLGLPPIAVTKINKKNVLHQIVWIRRYVSRKEYLLCGDDQQKRGWSFEICNQHCLGL